MKRREFIAGMAGAAAAAIVPIALIDNTDGLARGGIVDAVPGLVGDFQAGESLITVSEYKQFAGVSSARVLEEFDRIFMEIWRACAITGVAS